MNQQDIMNYFTYLINWNNQFDGELVEKERLLDLLDNIQDLKKEFEEIAISSEFMVNVIEQPTSWSKLMEDEDLLHNSNKLHYSLQDINETLQELWRIETEMSMRYNKLIGAPED